MSFGTFLLIGALAALVVALGAAVMDVVGRGDRRRRDLSVAAGWAGFALLGAALVLLAASFLDAANTIRYEYVWQNVKAHYDWFERLSGLWVGRPGSLLMWAVFILGFWCLEELRHRRAARRGDEAAVAGSLSAHHEAPAHDVDQAVLDVEAVRRWARLGAFTVALLFTVVVLYARPFAPVEAASLAQAPDGRGINPQLLIWYNAIHPPIVFLGYAATLLPGVFAFGHFATGRPGWLGPARRWAHLAFLVLTIGVTLGALWAYIALGWGGYWDWDPVEVASLVPWIMVVAFVHAAYRNDGKGMFPVAAPFLGLLIFAGTLFSTLVVRSGVWVSLHSFIAQGEAQDAWARYVGALEHPEVMLFSALIVAFVGSALVLASMQAARVDAGVIPSAVRPRPASRRSSSWLERVLAQVDLHNLFLAGVLLLVLLATVTVALLFVGINGFPSSGVREEIFVMRTGPVALSAVTVMAVAVSIGTVPKRAVLAMLAGAFLLGGVAALFMPDLWALAVAVPVLAFAATMAVVRVAMAWRRMPRRRAVRFSGIHLVHVGVAVVILGHGLVSTFHSTEDVVELRVGETREVGPYQVTLLDLQGMDTDGNRRVDEVTGRFQVTDGAGRTRESTAGFRFFDFQSHYKPSVGVLRTPGSDVYLAPKGLHDPAQGWIFGNLPLPEQGAAEARSVDAITVEVSTLPLINLVWGGTVLMVIGSAALGLSSWGGALAAHKSAPGRGARVREAAGPPVAGAHAVEASPGHPPKGP